MRRYGFINQSLVDYPGEVCGVIFIPGCNFQCQYCHNKSLAEDVSKDGFSLEEIMGYLTESKNFLTGICISGGEPTLSENDIFKIIHFVKSLKLKIKLDSNGSNPNVLLKLNNLVDYIAMDLKTSLNRYKELVCPEGQKTIIESIRKSMQILIKRDPKTYEFRTTLDWNFVNIDAINDLGKRISKNSRWYLQRCRQSNRSSSQEIVKETKKINEYKLLAMQYSNFVNVRS